MLDASLINTKTIATIENHKLILHKKGLSGLGDKCTGKLATITFVVLKIFSCLLIIPMLPTFLLIEAYYKRKARKVIEADNMALIREVCLNKDMKSNELDFFRKKGFIPDQRYLGTNPETCEILKKADEEYLQKGKREKDSHTEKSEKKNSVTEPSSIDSREPITPPEETITNSDSDSDSVQNLDSVSLSELSEDPPKEMTKSEKEKIYFDQYATNKFENDISLALAFRPYFSKTLYENREDQTYLSHLKTIILYACKLKNMDHREWKEDAIAEGIYNAMQKEQKDKNVSHVSIIEEFANAVASQHEVVEAATKILGNLVNLANQVAPGLIDVNADTKAKIEQSILAVMNKS